MMDALDQRRVGRIVREACTAAIDHAVEGRDGRARIQPNYPKAEHDREAFEAFEAELRIAGYEIVRLDR